MLEVQTRGDHDAFALLVERWENPIRRLCIRMTGDEHCGEDLAQEAFARVFASRRQYAPGRRFSTWLWRIALNLCCEEGRRASRNGAQLFAADHNAPSALPTSEAGPERRAIEREQAELVRAALANLSDIHRSVVVLREYEGLKYRVIAEVLELPQGTVKWRMAEALSQLAELLRAHAGELPDLESPIQPAKPITMRSLQ
jgi:RNA polymerase sigma-70 factor (ECF subfamily)